MEHNELDTELIQKFIEAYNTRVDWNRELCSTLGIDTFRSHPCTGQILDGVVDLDYITAEDCDLDNAKIYPWDIPGKYELQAYSYKYYATSYFWLNFNDTKEEYIKNRMQIIREEIVDTIDRLRPELEKLQFNVTALEILKSALNK